MSYINERIKLIVEDHIAQVSLARPEKMNALDQLMIDAIVQTGEIIRKDQSIRVVVLSGEGEHFCAGLDKSNFTALLETSEMSLAPNNSASENAKQFKLADRTHGVSNIYQHLVWLWRELPVPVLVAIEGIAFGGGLQIMLGGDCRFASSKSRFSILEMKWGLIPDMGGIQVMRQLVSDDVIRMLTYTAQEISAQQAKDWGFITDIVDDPLQHCLALAKQITQQNPDAIRVAKKVIEASNDLTAEQGLLLEAQSQDQIVGKPNQIEAVMSQLQKRLAEFSD